MDANKMRSSASSGCNPALFKDVRCFKNLLYLKALFYFPKPLNTPASRLFTAAFVIARDAFARRDLDLARTVSQDQFHPRQAVFEQIAWRQLNASNGRKKIRWMKKNMTHNGAAIALIDAHRANHPNQVVIRDRFLDLKFRS
jgi:hypothetical protein